MASCSSCGSSLTGTARYCAACGAGVDGDSVGGGGLFEVIDVTSASGPSRRGSRGDPGGFGWRWAVAAVAVVGLLGWMLTRSSDEAGQVEQSLEQDEESDEPTTTTRPRSSTIRRPSSTTTQPAPGVASVEGVAPGEPLLGEPVGLRIFLGDNGLRVIDLDTGELTRFAVDGAPMLADNEWLVVRTDVGSLAVLPASDPTAPSRRLAGDGWFPTIARDGPDHIWILDYEGGGGRPDWKSISIVDGTSRAMVELSSYPGGLDGPDVAGPPSGGVFVLGDDNLTYRRLADGTPLAASDDFILTQFCETPTSCRNYWIDRSSGEEIDRFVPPLDSWGTVRVSPKGRFLTVDSEVGPRLWDIERGEEIATLGYDDMGASTVGFSPDDRLAAYTNASRNRLILYDSESGNQYEIATSDRWSGISGLAFGPTAERASADASGQESTD